jgi:hypothetical protein
VFEVAVESVGNFMVQPFFAGKKVGAPAPVTLAALASGADLTRTPIDVAKGQAQ